MTQDKDIEGKGRPQIINGWFSEICPMWPGISLSLEIEKVLYSQKSRYQQIDLYQTTHHGKMLVLDGIIQLTQSDEFSYQEMLAHVPLFAHPAPERLLVIGGGDGGILREAGRHACLREIDFCEIDAQVIEVCRRFLPDLACGFDDPRVRVHIRDGNQFIRQQKEKYDVIIVDSSDPVGPGEVLFKEPFYRALKQALKPGGLIATQGESFFMHWEYVEDLVRIVHGLFDIHEYATILVPTYPGGNIGICMGSLGPVLKTPGRKIPETVQQQLKYYNREIHEASFVLPAFARRMMDNITAGR